MSENLSRRTLLVISDTSMRAPGISRLAYQPVTRELNALSKLFDEIIWLGCNDDRDYLSLAEVEDKKIKLIAMPSVHHRFLNIAFVALAYPFFLFYILRYLPRATHVHTRGPSHPAFISIFISLFDKKRTYAHKYAGAWLQNNVPFMYNLQRNLLKICARDNVYVTISGKYSNDNGHIIGFENPCLTTEEQSIGTSLATKKDFSGNLTLAFVGNIIAGKGILNLVSALNNPSLSSRINKIYIAGSGLLLDTIRKEIVSINKDIILTGQLTRSQLADVYAQSHIIILPSQSEGFPKVIAEAAAYGCIPAASNISAIPQYIIDGHNGFLLHDNSVQQIVRTLNHICSLNNAELSALSSAATHISIPFTYSHYIKRMKKVFFLTS
jgi:glycosyltransferase involved in cell wall biosynthesis